jgi:DNA adenine methylase
MLRKMDKQSTLNGLKAKSGNYKRYKGSPLRYAGGKSLAVGQILEKLPENIDSVMSPFMGGGSVEIAIAKELQIPVSAYDVFDLLVNFWQELLANNTGLAEKLETYSADRTTFGQIKTELTKHFKSIDLISDPLELAAKYYFNHNTSYGPGFLGWPSSIYMNESKWQNFIAKIRQFDVPLLSVSQASFIDSIPNNFDSFIYADPPYYLDGDSKMFKGIYPQRNFPIHHNGFDHETLRDLLLNHKAGFLLSYNDCSTIREWYADCEIYEPSWQYTMGQGETRIGANRLANQETHVKKSHELLIRKLPNG